MDEAIKRLQHKMKGLRVAAFSDGVAGVADPKGFAAHINEGLAAFERGEFKEAIIVEGGKELRIKPDADEPNTPTGSPEGA